MTVTPPPSRISVDLGERGYDILIGRQLLAHLVELLPGHLSGRIVVVTDETVARLHLESIQRALQPSGRLRGTVIVPPGEASKSFCQLETVCGSMLRLGVERDDVVVALGGGVVGDLAGFAAAILRRGVRLVQIPTTLLAQVDSSVGGKTGINTPDGKNLVGAFHQPSSVLVDLDVLASLPPRHMRAGYAEVVKYALLGDTSFFTWLDTHGSDVLARQSSSLQHAIATSISMKAALVVADERETGPRALLNLGHTFGHALEAYAGYSDRLLHGEAVAIGMCLATRFSEYVSVCAPDCADTVQRHLARLGLPTSIRDLGGTLPTADEFLALMMQDKKIKSGRLALVLLRAIGDAFVTRHNDHDVILQFLKSAIDAQ